MRETRGIQIDEHFIEAKEVYRQHWDYILYKSITNAEEYYVNIVFEKSFVSWSKTYKLTESETLIASSRNREAITAMIHQKRKENRT